MHGLYLIIYFTVIDIINTLLSPFFIAVFLIILYQYYKIDRSEYGLTINKSSFILKTVNSTLFGILGGIITTIAFIYLEVAIVPKDFMYILTTAIILSFINPRFMCFAYGGSIICLMSIFFGFPKIDTRDIMLVVATLHIVESLLIFLNGYKGKLPAYFESKDQYVGGYNINRFWPIPFVIFVGDSLIRPMTLMAILAYGDYTLSYPRKKTILTSLILLLYSSSLLLLIKMQINPILTPIYAIIGHEFIVQINKQREKHRTPIFTLTSKGVRVMEVGKKSIAKDLGIKSGDIVIRINEVLVNDENDIKEIESLSNPIFKIEYFNRNKGLITKKYFGDKKNLGILIVPRVMF